MEKNKRIFEIDVLKSIAILAMIFDHFTYLFSELGGVGGAGRYIFSNYSEINNQFLNNITLFCTKFQDSSLRNIGHYVFATLFLMLAGICSSFSRSNFKHSLKVLIGGFIITAVTIVMSIVSGEDMYIIFGILTTIGVSILLIALVEKIYDNKWIYLIIGSTLIIWGFSINWWDAPRIYFINQLDFTSFIEVIMGYKVYGLDHFGILPCTGVVFIGAFIGKTLYQNKKTKLSFLDGKWTAPFTFISKHALLVYLLHQVIGALIIFVIYLLVGYRI